MPIRKDVKPRKGGLAGALDSDVVKTDGLPSGPEPEEPKVQIGGQTRKSWRDYWAGRIKGEGKTVIGEIEQYFTAKYGTPKNPK